VAIRWLSRPAERRIVVRLDHERRDIDLTEPCGGGRIQVFVRALIHRQLVDVLEGELADPRSRWIAGTRAVPRSRA
jgi:hypothetical protein